MTRSAAVILYSTSACHLCELALEVIDAVRAMRGELQCREVDISEDDELFERYGLRIPVVRLPDGDELDWPFDTQQLHAALHAAEA